MWPVGAWQKEQRWQSTWLSLSCRLGTYLQGPDGGSQLPAQPFLLDGAPSGPSTPIGPSPAPARLCSPCSPLPAGGSSPQVLLRCCGRPLTAFQLQTPRTCPQALLRGTVPDLDPNSSSSQATFHFYLGIIDKRRCPQYMKLKGQTHFHVC